MLKVFSYWWIPVLSACVWWGMLIAMIGRWVAIGRPHYSWTPAEQDFPYISYIGATDWGKPIFISCAAVQGALFVGALASERYLRHAGRLLPNHRKREKFFAGFAIFWAAVGELGIVFVSIFDCVHYSHVHYSMLVVFIVCVGVSTLCTMAEFWLLDRRYKEYTALRVSTIFKVCWFIVELAFAITFAATRHHRNLSSAFEWAVSFIYPFYALCLAFDLAPAHGTPKGAFLKYASEEVFHDEEKQSTSSGSDSRDIAYHQQ